MNKEFKKNTLLQIIPLLEEFLSNTPSDEEIGEMENLDADAYDIIEIYAEAQNLKQAIKNAGL